MLDIKVKKQRGKELYRLAINGTLLVHSEVEFLEGTPKFYGILTDAEEAQTISNHTFQNVEPYFITLTLPFKVESSPHFIDVEILFTAEDGYKANSLSFQAVVNLEIWTNPYTVAEYVRALDKSAKAFGTDIIFEEHRSIFDNERKLVFIAHFRSMDSIIHEEIAFWGEKVKQICDAAIDGLLSKLSRGSLFTLFHFPPAFKNACQQYLVYFAQFLEDMGINANAQINEDAGRVLFGITPKDGNTALNKIKEALDLYLRLPGVPTFMQASAGYSDVAVAQLRANVFHLQSQVELAKATIQAKDAAIQLLDLALFQQRQLTTGTTTAETTRDIKKEAASEPILGDTVHLTQYEGKFLRVELPTILRRLKRSFGIGEKKDQPKQGT